MRENRNIRVVLAAERDGRFLALDAFGTFPHAHLREGESLRYAIGNLARTFGLEVRVVGIAAIAEREGARFSARTIDVYVLASTTHERGDDERWLTAQELARGGVPRELVHVLDTGRTVPYLGKL